MLPLPLRRALVRGGGLGPRLRRAPPRPPLSPPCRPGQRAFSTAVFTVRARAGEAGEEQTLFVVGLNEGKFFGQDSAEEALKLLERIAEHAGPQGPQYTLLFGLSERELNELEEEHKVKNQRLTPSRELEGRRHCEVVPIVQAGMVDKRPRRPLGRILRTTQSHVAVMLWKHPREAVKLYWAYWKRKEYKDAAARSFWSEHFPTASYAYFVECSELIAIRATELLAASNLQGKGGVWVLVVSNQLFDPVTEWLRALLDDDAAEKFRTPEFLRELRERASKLCLDVADLTPVLVFIYLGLPLLTLQFVAYAAQALITRSGIPDKVLPAGEHRD